MSRFVISGTTCVTRIPGKDEIAEFFLHAKEVGYKAWGAAGPLFWTPGLVRWANFDLLVYLRKLVLDVTGRLPI